MSLPISYRPLTQNDESFIYSSWLKSYRNTEDCTRMTNDTYFSIYKGIVSKAISDSNILIACNPDDESQVYGYICYKYEDSVPVVHYIYTKFTYRKLGIARDLLNIAIPTAKIDPIVTTHANRIFDSLKETHMLVYKPNLR